MNNNLILRKIIMRTSLFVLISAIFIPFIHAEDIYGQILKERNITYNAKGIDINHIFSDLSKQTGFHFFYDESALEGVSTVTLNVKNTSLDNILKEITRQTGLVFKQIDNTISVSREQPVISSGNIVQQDNKLTISGVINDDRGEPIIGANVIEKGTLNGVITDMDGNFSITVSPDAILQISYIGYISQEIAVKKQTYLAITMKEDAQALEEVVVVGYATQKKANITGAVASVSSKQLESRPMTNIGQGIQGLVPNVNITVPSGGNPGIGTGYNIRGTTSLSGGEPLIIVDGVQMDPNLINPQDIESISFLKDAAASSIYGARAAYGVMLITTKKGSDEKPRISYSNNLSINSPTFLPKMQNSLEWAETINRGMTNLGNNPFVSDLWLQHIKDYMANPDTAPNWYADPNGYANGGGGNFNYCGNVDYYKETYSKTAFMQQHTASIQGGTSKFGYYTSLGYYQQDGFLKYADDAYKRYNMKINLSAQITDWLKIGVNTTYNSTNKQNPAGVYWGSNPDGGRYDLNIGSSFIGGTWPVIPLTHSGYAGLDDENPSYNLSWTNPIQLQRDSGKETKKINDLWLGGNVDITPLKGLNIHADFTRNIYRNTNKNHVKKMMSQDPMTGNWMEMVHTKNNWVTMDNAEKDYYALNAIVDYTTSIKDHNFKFLAGMNHEKNHYRWFFARRMGLINNDFPAMNQAIGAEKTNYSENEWAILGYFGRINYNFSEKYFLEMNARYDGSSRFPENDKFAFFPSFSVGWMISNEAFFEKATKVVNSLKLRGSWGSLGNLPSSDAIGLYPYIPNLGTISQISYVMNNTRPVGITPAALTTNMSWEEVKQWNIGIDFGFLNNKLVGSFDYYNRGTYGMIGAGSPLPAVLGTGVPLQNSSDLMTKGYELTLNWRSNIGKDFHYNAGIVFSDNYAEITAFDNPTGLISSYYVGQRLNDVWGYHSDGHFQTDAEAEAYQAKYDVSQLTGRKLKAGDVRYIDRNGDGKITPALTTSDTGDQTVIGNGTPRYMYGINLGADWKGIDLRIFLQGIGRRDVNLSGFSNVSDQWQETYSYLSDTWTPDNPNAYWPRVTVGDGGYNRQARTTTIENAGYMRLKDITVGYTLPKTWMQKVGLQNVRFYFSGYNLLTFMSMRKDMFDPETFNTHGYPIFKSVSFGIDIVL